MRRRTLVMLALLFGATAAACGGDAPATDGDVAGANALEGDTGPGADGAPVVDDGPPIAAPEAPEEPEEPWITYQPRLEELRRRTPEDLGWSPGTTEWATARRPVPEYLTEAYVREHGGPESPGEAMLALAEEIQVLEELHVEGQQEVTVRATRDAGDQATGVLLYWGALDDAVAGMDLRVVLRSVADRGWYIARIEERFHCRRGVSDELCA